jgi:hypothetical protein
MTGLRALIAALIAISISIAPVIGEAGVSATSIEMSMPGDANMPCCPPGDGKASFTCDLKCLNFAAALFPAAILLPVIGNRPSLPTVNETLVGHVTPPSHPPPI